MSEAVRSRIARAMCDYGTEPPHDEPCDLCREVAGAVVDALGLEQVGWLQDADTNDPAPVKMQHGEAFYVGEVGVCVPIYRLGPSSSPEGENQ